MRDDTRRMGAPSRKEPATSSRASISASAMLSASATSHLVSTMAPRGMASSRQMWKCSRVCGITDSSAAMTSRTASMPWAPASMLRTNRSWPGTSMNDATAPSAEVQVGEAEIDGDPALLLLLQPVGVGAGEGAHERALPVVDVARGADDEGAHDVSGHPATPRGW